MARLVLGPLLRYVGETEATVWVETDSRCEVVVLDHSARTFEVDGHHYALVRIEGLPVASAVEYGVTLDGERVWPPPDHDFPPSLIRTLDPDGPVRISFGSCRVAYPHRPPYSLPKDENPEGREVDALYALARRMRREPPDTWPHLLLLLGDQVYADEASPKVREFIAGRRDPSVPPGYEVADFEEYVRLYYETWGDTDPDVRWLLSTVSTAMVWDDHDVHDDWNTSDVWLAEMRRKRDRFWGALTSMGYDVVKPSGAFYMFPRSPIANDVAFVRELQQELVLTVPGVGFGRPGHFRISYCVEDETIERALPGFERAVARRR